MKTKAWPFKAVNDVRNRLIKNNYKNNLTNMWIPNDDNSFSDHWFILEPLYSNVILELYIDGVSVTIKDVLNNKNKYEEELVADCIFFMDVLK
jgi:hypothetical protein